MGKSQTDDGRKYEGDDPSQWDFDHELGQEKGQRLVESRSALAGKYSALLSGLDQ